MIDHFPTLGIVSARANLLAEHGYLGRKTGRGFYRYNPESGLASEDQEVIELIRSEARHLGVKPTNLSEYEIQQRMIRAIEVAEASPEALVCQAYCLTSVPSALGKRPATTS